MADYNIKLNVDAQAATKSLETFGSSVEKDLKKLSEFNNVMKKSGKNAKELAEWFEKQNNKLLSLDNLYKQSTKDAAAHTREMEKQNKIAKQYTANLDKLSAKYLKQNEIQQKTKMLFAELTTLHKEGLITSKQLIAIFDKQARIIDGTAAAEEKLLAITIRKNKALKDLRKKYDPLFAAQKEYKRNIIDIEKLRRKQLITGKEYLILIQREKEALSSATSIQERHKQALAAEGKALNDLKAKYDPVYAAQAKYAKSLGDIYNLYNKGKISANAYSKAIGEQERILQKALNALRPLNDAHTKELNKLKELRAQYDTSYAAVQRYSKAKADLKRLVESNVISQSRYNKLLAEAKLRMKDQAGFTEKASNSTKKLNENLTKQNGILAVLQRSWNGYTQALRVAWKVFFGFTVAKTLGNWALGFAKVGESVELLGRKLTVLTGEEDALGKVATSAHKVGIDLKTLNKTITRFAITTKKAYNVDEMLRWTEALIKSGRVAGTTNQELQSGLLQLSQSLSAGRLMGDEFRSISENLPFLKIELQKVFEEMGMGSVALKQLSRDGLITNDILIKAFQNLGITVADMPGALGTIDASIASLATQASFFIAEMTKGGSFVSNSIKSMADALLYLRQSIFGAIKGEEKLNEAFVDSTLAINSATGELEQTVQVIDKATGVINPLIAAVFGATSAMAAGEEKAEEFSVAVTLLGTAMTVLVPLFAAGVTVRLAAFVAGIAGLGTAAKVAGVGVRFLTAGVNGLKAALLLSAVGLNKFFGILKSGAGLFKSVFSVAGATMMAYAAAIAYPIAALVDHFDKLERLKVVHEEYIPLVKSTAESLREMKAGFSELSVADLNDKMAENAVQMVENERVSNILRERIKDLSGQIALAPGNVEALKSQMVTLIGVMNKLGLESRILAIEIQAAGEKSTEIAVDFETARKKGQDFLDGIKNSQGADKALVAFNLQQVKTIKFYDDMKESIKGITTEQSVWIDKMKDTAMKRAAQHFDETANSSKKAEKELSKLVLAREKYNELLKAGIGGKQLQDAKDDIAKWDGTLDRIKALDKALKDSAKASDELRKKENDALKEKTDLWKKFNPELSKYLEESKLLAEALKQGVITEEQFNKLLAEQQKLLKKNTGQMTDYEKAIDGWNSGMKKFAEESQDYYSQMDEFSQKTMNSMTDALTEFVTTGKMDFKSLVDSIIKDLTRIAIKNSITGPLAEMMGGGGNTSGGGSSGGGIFGSLLGGMSGGGTGTANTLTAGGGGIGGMISNAAMMLGFKNGGAFSNGVQAYARGGVVNSPTIFPMANGAGLMGEAGPEAIMPLTRKNGKLGVESTGGSGTSIVININVAGTNGDSEAMRRSAGQVAQAAGNATSRAMRRNG